MNRLLLDSAVGADGGDDDCDVLTQTGCPVGKKCTWFEDGVGIGHIDCAPDGSAATGAACNFGAVGAAGYDNCVRGDVCNGAECRLICDKAGGAPMCATGFACATQDGLFGPIGQAVAAGICEATCDPLADNDFDGSGSSSAKTGSSCAPGEGCYGAPDDMAASHYTCMAELNPTLHHRDACTVADQCANSAEQPYVNGCAQGYLPLLYDAVGSMQVDCIAMCNPANCSSGNCGASNTANLTGNPMATTAGQIYQCSDQHELGTFDGLPNGDQCMYSYVFEEDITTGVIHESPTSDTVGFCVDHTKIQYDSTGGGSANAPWPICNSFTTLGRGTGSAVAGDTPPCNATNGCVGAADFGCVDSVTGGVMSMFADKTHVIIERPRMLYRRSKME